MPLSGAGSFFPVSIGFRTSWPRFRGRLTEIAHANPDRPAAARAVAEERGLVLTAVPAGPNKKQRQAAAHREQQRLARDRLWLYPVVSRGVTSTGQLPGSRRSSSVTMPRASWAWLTATRYNLINCAAGTNNLRWLQQTSDLWTMPAISPRRSVGRPEIKSKNRLASMKHHHRFQDGAEPALIPCRKISHGCCRKPR